MESTVSLRGAPSGGWSSEGCPRRGAEGAFLPRWPSSLAWPGAAPTEREAGAGSCKGKHRAST